MTIAAGLLCKEGVLLCADTEATSWESKSHASKIRCFEFPGGKVAFAYAGNTRFASSAIRRCQKKLTETRKPDTAKMFDPLSDLEEVLDKEYRRNVLMHPSQASDSGLHYQFLIALWFEGNTKLYVTDQTSIDEVLEFDCIGIGEPLARHLIGPGASARMPYQQALPLAAYALAIVKDQIRDCDGMSVFMMLGNDGEVSTATSLHPGPCAQLERYAKGYDFLTRRLLMYLADPTTEEEYFEANIGTIVNDVRRIFKEILSDRKHQEEELALKNPYLDPSQVKRLALQWSMGLPLNPQPSKAPPGGSGES